MKSTEIKQPMKKMTLFYGDMQRKETELTALHEVCALHVK